MKMFEGFKEQEVKNDLVCSWNEADEARESLEMCIMMMEKDEMLEKSLEAIKDRVERIMDWLSKYADESDVLEDIS